MNWDDLRYVLALSAVGSLAKAAKVLDVDHTTVGRRIEAAEAALGVRLFTRTTTGYVPTADADRLIGPMRQVEEAVLAVERGAVARRDTLEGAVRITSPETFGVAYLAPRLAVFGQQHPGLQIELVAAGEVLDLGRRQAELAVRFFPSKGDALAVRKVGEVTYGLYATRAYLGRKRLRTPAELTGHRVLSAPGIETDWLARLNAKVTPAFTSTLSLALLSAAKASAGVAVLPRYLGDAEPDLTYVRMPGEPGEPVFLTVHRDLRSSPRIRALLDFLAAALEADRAVLAPTRSP